MGDTMNDKVNHLLQSMMRCAQISKGFPSNEDREYYLSLYPELRPLIEETQRNCIKLAESIMNLDASSNITIPKLDYNDPDEILQSYNDIIYVTDEKLENCDNFFDEVRRGARSTNESELKIQTVDTGRNVYQVHRMKNIQRPQLQFEAIDNSKEVFIPKISSKSNAKIPLEETKKQFEKLKQQCEKDNSTLYFPNPYEYELDNLTYLPKQLKKRDPIVYKSVDIIPLSYIDTKTELDIMLQKLKKVDEIAVDLEHHAYRSYQGFTCLIQISTRNEDFIVDTIALRQYIHLLNEIFTNPNIIKVLHGSDNDILWLQRDFGIYIVNLFDTGQAARQLNYPKLSLSYLLDKFCDINVDKKKFQLADWRIRPLPNDMLNYARSDTHYLLYIHDRMQNELIENGNANNNLLNFALNQSKEICKRVYTKDIFQPTLESIQKKCPPLNEEQSSVLNALFEWRDFFAREEDESIRYILPNHMLIHIAELMPQDPIELFSCCNPQPPPFIKSNATDVIHVINAAKENKPQTLISKKGKHFSTNNDNSITSITKNTQQSSTIPSLLSDANLSQDQLFKSADWFQSSIKRTAGLDPSNEKSNQVSSPNTKFFGKKSKITTKNEKLQKLNETLMSDFNITSSLPSVPDSMEEIYQFSNANRKRNKEKKKLKEDSINAGPVSPIKFGDEPSPKKPENTEQFLKKIGWVSEEAKPLIQSSKKKIKKNSTKSNPQSSTTSYDYSKHKSSNYGLYKEQPKQKQKKDNDNDITVSVPSFGKSSNRIRSNKVSQRGKSYTSRGGQSRRGRGQ